MRAEEPMQRSGISQFAALVAAVFLAIGTLVAGGTIAPPPAAAAYCDDYPVLCSTFTAVPQGSGNGSITTSDGSINCQWSGGVKSGTCSKRFIEDGNGNVTITLTYAAAPGSYVCEFISCWSSQHTTQLIFSSDTSRTVTFALADCTVVPVAWCADLVIATSGNGRGSVTTADGAIGCTYNGGPTTGACEHAYFIGPDGGMIQIQVHGTANADSIVCEDNLCGATRSFTIGISEDHTLSFDFDLKTYDVTIARGGSGSGRVIGTPGGIDCGSSCMKSYTHGDALTLVAAPDAGSIFSSWSGPCAGQDASCDIRVTATSTITATFTRATTSPGPGATTGATAGPGATSSTPTASTVPGGTIPVATAPGSAGPTAAASGAVASGETDPSALPGATSSAAGQATPGPSGEPAPAVVRGADLTIIALAIVVAGVLVAVGLAFGLRRRAAEPSTPAESGPHVE